jgi:hypothetical protein
MPAPDGLARLLHALHAFCALAEQRGPDTSAARKDACVALTGVVGALEKFHTDLEQELRDRYPTSSRFSALLVEHVRRCAARQRADVVRLRAQVERSELSVPAGLQAAWTLSLVMRVEVAQLAHDVRL